MPLQLPTLDDRSFEQLLTEAKRRIPVHTPEWTNFADESDPGITIVEVFCYVAEALIYRANRVPELNRLKFLELLDVGLQPAAAAEGLVSITPGGPTAAVLLDTGVILAAGAVRYLTTGGLTVLPITAQAFYKSGIPQTDPNYASYEVKYAAVLAAAESAAEDQAGNSSNVATTASASVPANSTDFTLGFYQSLPMPLPTASNPNPSLSLLNDTIDGAIYLAILAPVNVDPETVRGAIGGKTLSIGIVPMLSTSTAPPLEPLVRQSPQTTVDPGLIFEIANASVPVSSGAAYSALQIVQQADVIDEPGVVQVLLPSASQLQTWIFTEPLTEGTGQFPPTIEDQSVATRLVTWIRIRLPSNSTASTATTTNNKPAATGATTSLDADLSWVGINAVQVIQAIPVVNESLSVGTGEPDQTVTLANNPVLTDTLVLQIQDVSGSTGVLQTWRLVDDLLSTGPTDLVFTADPESGVLSFGTGEYGQRPGPNCQMFASYQYGGGLVGNVAAGAVKTSPDPRLQGTFTIANPIATWGGTDGETVEEGQARIPLYLRHRDRLVTAQDFIDVTMSTAGVNMGRVEVLPLYRPPTSDLPNPPTQVPGTVTVMVIPANDAVQPLWPMPDNLFLQKVCTWLNPRRLVTTEIFVRGPVYVNIYLSIGIEILPGNFRDVVIAAVMNTLQEFLSSLSPGGPENTGWPINKNVLAAELEAVADRVTGVDYAYPVILTTDVSPTVSLATVALTNLQLPLLKQIGVVQGTPGPLTTATSASGPATLPVPVPRSKC